MNNPEYIQSKEFSFMLHKSFASHVLDCAQEVIDGKVSHVSLEYLPFVRSILATLGYDETKVIETDKVINRGQTTIKLLYLSVF